MVYTKSGWRVITLTDGEKLQYSYRKFAEEDELALIEFLKTNLHTRSDFWVWKYKSNPDFDSSMVAVAEKDGEIVGCNHWLERDLKLSSSLKVRAVLAADIVVHPKHRGRGIGTQLLRFLRLSEVFKKKKIALSYMFAPPKLSKRLYAPVVGYVAAPNSTTTYKKFFNCRELKEEFQRINEMIKSRKELQKKLEGLRMCISFRLKGVPVFAIHIESERVYLEEGEVENPDVIIEGSLPLSFSMMKVKQGIWGLAKTWITGEVKIKKGLMKIFKVLKIFKVFKLAVSGD
jgi:GNAT superfamily N-acetyltransferase/putative sterol carrier protein